MRKRRYTSVITFNLALLPWSVGSVVWIAKVTPAEDRDVRSLLLAPLKYFSPLRMNDAIPAAVEALDIERLLHRKAISPSPEKF